MDQLSSLIEVLRAAPTDRIVDTLRALHGARPAMPPSQPLSSAAGPVGDAAGLVGHAQRATSRGDATPPRRFAGEGRPKTDADRYDHARGFFVNLEKRLARERSVMETLIERMRYREQARVLPAAACPAQQLLRIVAVEGAPGAGRFVVTNPFERETAITLSVRDARSRSTGTLCAVPIEFAPANVTVAARGWCHVGLTIDPASGALRAGEPLDLCIEAKSAGRVVMKLRVEVDVFPQETSDG